MTKLIVAQIKGSNGSGKSSIVKQLMAYYLDGAEPEYLMTSYGDVCGTLNPMVGWIGVGKYDPAKPTRIGCDPIPTIAQIKASIELTIKYALKKDRDEIIGIVFEGMMISTIKTTFYDFLARMEEKYKEIQPVYVIIDAAPEGCINRISGRGTMRASFKPEEIVKKCALVLRHAREYDPSLVRYLNVEETPLEMMGIRFLDLVGDLDLMNQILEDGEYLNVGIECGV